MTTKNSRYRVVYDASFQLTITNDNEILKTCKKLMIKLKSLSDKT